MSFFKLCAFSSVLALSLASVSVSACLAEDSKGGADKGHSEWGYVSSHGAVHWGELHENYTACMQGEEQSPVNIAQYMKKDLPNFQIEYGAFPLTVKNTGQMVKVKVPEGQKLTVDGTTYNLRKMAFHTPSEHYIDGTPYPMELQLVHKTDDGAIGIVSVMLKVGQANATIEKIWGHIPAEGESATGEEGETITALDLLPARGAYYTYKGSLTTPPCKEGVTWYVMQDPIEISEGQLRAFQALYPVNARPVQPLGQRVIEGD